MMLFSCHLLPSLNHCMELQQGGGTMKQNIMCAEQATAMLIVTVMIGLMTSTQNTLTRAPRAEEVEEVTAMLGRLQVKEEELAPCKGNWAYCKSLPSPDDLPSPSQDVAPEEWDDVLNPQEAEEGEEEEPLNSGQKALIARIVRRA